MSCLSELLAQRDRSIPLWRTKDREFTYGAAQEQLGSFQELVCALAGRRVAVRLRDDLSAAVALVLLDGRAEALLLLPSDLNRTDLEFYLAQGRIDALLTSQPQEGLSVAQFPFALGSSAPVPDVPAGQVATSISHPTQWLLLTSGTTGKPKIIPHTLASLTRTTKQGRAAEPLVWGLLYGLTRFAGLQVYFQALLGNGTLAITSDDEPLQSRIEILRELGCSALSATPTMWRKFLMCANVEGLNLRQVTLGGEVADRQILAALRKQFPQARMVHIYASTEAGVGFSVSDGQEGFPAAWLQAAPQGVELKVGASGRLMLRAAGVRLPSRATGEGEWIDTGDLVKLEGDRYLFLGRANGAVNVAGNKVMPEEVERVILEVPGVFAAQVRGRKSSLVGSLVEARVVPSHTCGDCQELIERVRSHCRARLEPFKIPAFIEIASTLETSSAGKAQRGTET